MFLKGIQNLPFSSMNQLKLFLSYYMGRKLYLTKMLPYNWDNLF